MGHSSHTSSGHNSSNWSHQNSFSGSRVSFPSHSVSIGEPIVKPEDLPEQLEGTLGVLAAAAEQARNTLDKKNDLKDIREIAYPEDISNILYNSGGTKPPLYQHGRYELNITSQQMNSGNGYDRNDHQNTSGENTAFSPLNISFHSNTSGNSFHGNTSTNKLPVFDQNSATPDYVSSNKNINAIENEEYINFPRKNIFYEKDSSMLKSQLTSILEVINSGIIESSDIASFGTWKIVGNNKRLHSNHQNHSSYY